MCRRGPLQSGGLESGGPGGNCQVHRCPGGSLGCRWGAGGCGPQGGGQGSGGGPRARHRSHPQVGVLEFLCCLQTTLVSCPHAPTPARFRDPISCLGFSRRAWECRGSSLGLPYPCGFPKFSPAVSLGESLQERAWRAGLWLVFPKSVPAALCLCQVPHGTRVEGMPSPPPTK